MHSLWKRYTRGFQITFVLCYHGTLVAGLDDQVTDYHPAISAGVLEALWCGSVVWHLVEEESDTYMNEVNKWDLKEGLILYFLSSWGEKCFFSFLLFCAFLFFLIG